MNTGCAGVLKILAERDETPSPQPPSPHTHQSVQQTPPVKPEGNPRTERVSIRRRAVYRPEKYGERNEFGFTGQNRTGRTGTRKPRRPAIGDGWATVVSLPPTTVGPRKFRRGVVSRARRRAEIRPHVFRMAETNVHGRARDRPLIIDGRRRSIYRIGRSRNKSRTRSFVAHARARTTANVKTESFRSAFFVRPLNISLR